MREQNPDSDNAAALLYGRLGVLALVVLICHLPPGWAQESKYIVEPLAQIDANAVPVTESNAIATPICNLATYGIQEPKIAPPEARVDDFGAKGDGIADDGAAIRAAIASLRNGGTVVFTKGKTYRKTGTIVVDRPGVRLWGYGAILYAFIPDVSLLSKLGAAGLSITLQAPSTGVYGLTIVSNLRVRLTGHPNNAAVQVIDHGQEVIDTHAEYTLTGIFVRGGTQFVIARNVVYRTTADGIHMTSGTLGGKVVCNAVRQNGDDMIAVVNYGDGEPNIGNVLIENNDVAGQYSGRGISVVGGRDVTIRGNMIADTAGAGILINSENAYKTANVRNVLVEGNDIRSVHVKDPPYNPRSPVSRRSAQGAIDVNAQGTRQVSEVLIRDNTIVDAGTDGVYVRGGSCRIGIARNRMSQVGRTAIKIESSTSAECNVACEGNVLDGQPADARECAGPIHAVTGASP